MRTTKTMTISLPPAMVRQLESVRKLEHRTRSELMREALRQYFESRFPEVTPTKAELAAIRRGRADIKAGRFVTLEQLRDELAATDRRPSAKSTRKTPR
jgi:CopG family transcriptional regulator/antitoxin EndoAI